MTWSTWSTLPNKWTTTQSITANSRANWRAQRRTSLNNSWLRHQVQTKLRVTEVRTQDRCQRQTKIVNDPSSWLKVALRKLLQKLKLGIQKCRQLISLSQASKAQLRVALHHTTSTHNNKTSRLILQMWQRRAKTHTQETSHLWMPHVRIRSHQHSLSHQILKQTKSLKSEKWPKRLPLKCRCQCQWPKTWQTSKTTK